MKIKNITYRGGNDFKAVFECEHCLKTQEKWGYDDANFHQNVIPEMECKFCKKSTQEAL